MQGMYTIVLRAQLPVPGLLRQEGHLGILSTETRQHPSRRCHKSRLFYEGSRVSDGEIAGDTLRGERGCRDAGGS